MAISSAMRCAPTTAATPIRVLIVDDSAVARAALSRTVSEAPEFDVVAALDGGRRAIDWLSTNRVDVLLLDVQMPGLDGIAALPELLEVSQGARVLIVSTLAGAGACTSIQALALGAADTLAKPDVGAMGRQFGAILIDKMLKLGKASPAAVAETCEPQLLRSVDGTPIACLAIGASTGGLHAFASFFGALADDFDAPILVTQHLPAVFMPYFADQLGTLSGRTVRVAKGGETLGRSEILVAPGDAHLGLERSGPVVKTVLLDQAAVSRCCPSVDPMFVHVAEYFGEGAVGVILSGMGRDGEIGARAIADAGGTIVVQDAVSSAVWGMPGTVARAGLASVIAPPSGLAAYVGRRGAAR
jgi:two-component system, chemotaxis family, protein-glutamate methylesterase/glutaminase